MHLKNTLCAAIAASLFTVGAANADKLTVATVNNGDMIRMQGLTEDFTLRKPVTLLSGLL